MQKPSNTTIVAPIGIKKRRAEEQTYQVPESQVRELMLPKITIKVPDTCAVEGLIWKKRTKIGAYLRIYGSLTPQIGTKGMILQVKWKLVSDLFVPALGFDVVARIIDMAEAQQLLECAKRPITEQKEIADKRITRE